MTANRTILVGVSGSAASVAALRWARTEAERDRCRLRVVLAWQPEQRASYAQRADRIEGTAGPEEARRVLTRTARAVLGPGPWRNTSVQAVQGRAEQALVAASDDADLLVLGSGPAAVIGPVIRTCLAEAHCPVVVVSSIRPLRGQHLGVRASRRGDRRVGAAELEHHLRVPAAGEQRVDRAPVPR